MKLSFFLKESGIFLGLQASSPREMIEKAIALAPAEKFAGSTREEVLTALLKSEARAATPMGEMSFLPHVRIEGLHEPFLLLATCLEPFEVTGANAARAMVRLCFVLVTPTTSNTFMLQTMAAIAKLIASPEQERALAGIKSTSRILRHIEDLAVEIRKILIAADIMVENPRVLAKEMTLSRAVQNLVEKGADAMAVVGPDGKLEGELGSDQIFAIGVPRFLSLMTDTSELAQFEAFSKFFESEHDLLVGETMALDAVVVRPESSVMSVAHQLTLKRRSKAYVVHKGLVVGEIDRRDILKKVFAA